MKAPAARVGLALATLAATGIPLLGQTPTQSRSLAEDMRMFSQVLNQIRVNHPDSLDTHTLLMAAIQGMVSAADPHSYVLPAVHFSPEREEARRRDELHPVPIDFSYVDDAPVVVSVYPGTEAAELGITVGDELVAIEGEPVTAESARELDLVLEGREGSRVALTFIRRGLDGSVVTLRRQVKRERLDSSPAVGAATMLDHNTGYVRLLHFASEDIAQELADTLNSLERQRMARLVLDLRDNSGGLVRAAGAVAGQFLPDGAIVYTTEGRKADVADTLRVERLPEQFQREQPLVVLVNSSTASAAELVAGALQDHDRAAIVGRPTFGKSLIMRQFPMTDGSQIALVIGHVKTPCGRTVQREYHGIRRLDYLRQAGAVVDTAGRPSCTTAGGRTVYGGGGIYPDVVLDPPGAAPDWILRVQERELLTRWVGSFLADSTIATTSPVDFASAPLSEETVESFVRFATEEGLDVTSAKSDAAVLNNVLVLSIVWARWGPSGYYTVLAHLGSDVSAAVEALDNVDRILSGN